MRTKPVPPTSPSDPTATPPPAAASSPRTGKTCYFCGQPKTSREHVPPQSFFPDDAKLRVNLITVPSCTEHNQDTSDDDEYIRNIIMMFIGNNAVAAEHFMDKGKRSLERNAPLLAQTVGNAQRVYVGKEGESITPTVAFDVDRKRIDRMLRKMGYALFFHQYKKPWPRALGIMSEHLLMADMRPDASGEFVQKFAPMLPELDFSGQNKAVFQYRFFPPGNTHIPDDNLLHLKFYESFEVWLAPNPGSEGPTLDEFMVNPMPISALGE